MSNVIKIYLFFSFVESAHSELGPGTGGVFPAHNRDDEVSSTSSEKYERDVTILNHCFDDIEKFIARLQHAAAASRELERRRRLVVFTCGLRYLHHDHLYYLCLLFCFICESFCIFCVEFSKYS
jgi:hypothetical protein